LDIKTIEAFLHTVVIALKEAILPWYVFLNVADDQQSTDMYQMLLISKTTFGP